MIKKILLGVLFAGITGFLIFGAVNRTLAKAGDVRTETNGGGRYQDLDKNYDDLDNRGNPTLRNQQVNRSESDPAYGIGK